jgi:hypothetical protein
MVACYAGRPLGLITRRGFFICPIYSPKLSKNFAPGCPESGPLIPRIAPRYLPNAAASWLSAWLRGARSHGTVRRGLEFRGISFEGRDSGSGKCKLTTEPPILDPQRSNQRCFFKVSARKLKRLHPSIDFLGDGNDGGLDPAPRPTHRKSEFSLPPLGCSSPFAQISRYFLPRCEYGLHLFCV